MRVGAWSADLIEVPEQNRGNRGVEEWWNSELTGLQQNVRRVKAALMMYTA